MWQAEFQFNGNSAPAGSLAKKYGVTITAYPISFSEQKNNLLAFFACNIFGMKENQESFFKHIKKHKNVSFFERDEDFFIIQLKEPLKTKSVYNQNILHTKPIFISKTALETWSVASTNKESLTKFYEYYKENRNAKLLFIKKTNKTSISISQINPRLTKKQKDSVDLAIKEGYYEVPRKINITNLAKKAKLSFATYQVHLRKAEKKLIPTTFFKYINNDNYR
ncbi:MAG: helix-turn-helix domain-containing protein [Candidatus Woesearchaeota archaeon]